MESGLEGGWESDLSAFDDGFGGFRWWFEGWLAPSTWQQPRQAVLDFASEVRLGVGLVLEIDLDFEAGLGLEVVLVLVPADEAIAVEPF